MAVQTVSQENLGLTESVSMAPGGMIGGGIYAVLDVVASITGPGIWVAFVAVELLYFERGEFEREIDAIEEAAFSDEESLPPEPE